jgi:queuosine precursor transporter
VQTTRSYRYYDLMMAAFVTVLVCSNLIGPAKISQIEVPVLGTLTFGAGLLFFPISFIFGDILTEVYGYSRSRKVIWAGFAGLAFASFMAWMIVALPAAPFWHNQEAYEVAFGSAWRVSLASLVAFAAGEFVNSYIMAKMKVMTAGRWLWMRTIGSTIFGEGVDSALFYPLAFYGSGVIPDDKLPLVMLAQFVAKVGVEVVFTPVTYKVVAWLKRAENEDYYDRHTDFNPFALKTDT